MKAIPPYTLCITIPTYNREKYLQRLLESIVTQEWFTDEVSIIINDGPSKDNTTQMVADYQKKYQNITYTRNDIAVGMLPAILESIDISNGRYTRLFGSDDFMQEDALKITLDIIKDNSPTLILSNRTTFTRIDECDIQKTKNVKSLYFNWFSDFWTYFGLNEEEKYQDKRNYLTFMSVFCFDSNYYKEMLEYVKVNVCSLDELKKHYFNYIVILFAQLFADKVICIVERPRLVFCQWGNTSREPNKKINQDVKMLMDYLKNTYSLPLKCIKLFKRMYFDSYLFGNIIYKIQKIYIFWVIIKSLMRNKTAISVYTRLTKLVTGSK